MNLVGRVQALRSTYVLLIGDMSPYVLVAYGVVGVVVVGVCNRSQMRTSKRTCFIFGVSIGLDPGYKHTKRIFDRSKFKVTSDISPTIRSLESLDGFQFHYPIERYVHGRRIYLSESSGSKQSVLM